jgi:hypothetical protein
MNDRREPPAGDVLSSLPSTRPQRRSARRQDAGAKAAPAQRSARAPARKPTGRGGRATKAAGAARGGKAKATRPKGVRPSAATRAASKPPGERPPQAPQGVELVGTAIQAAGELAQLGLELGTKALAGAIRRLPRP